VFSRKIETTKVSCSNHHRNEKPTIYAILAKVCNFSLTRFIRTSYETITAHSLAELVTLTTASWQKSPLTIITISPFIEKTYSVFLPNDIIGTALAKKFVKEKCSHF
jgi:hypothetical protein